MLKIRKKIFNFNYIKNLVHSKFFYISEFFQKRGYRGIGCKCNWNRFENFERLLRRIGWCFSSKTIRNGESSPLTCFFGLSRYRRVREIVIFQDFWHFSLRPQRLSLVNSRTCNSRWMDQLIFTTYHRVYAFPGKNIGHLSHSSSFAFKFPRRLSLRYRWIFFFFLIKRTTQS